MIKEEALADLIRTAEGEGIRFISDEIYHGLDYAFPAVTAARLSDRAVIINSFSKYFCMTGWRIGWMVVPPPLVRPIERLQQNLAISVPTLAQIAAEAAFDGRAEMEAIKHGYEENRRILIEGLPKAGLGTFLPVDGAFYLYADVSPSPTTASPLPSGCWRRPASRRRPGWTSTRCADSRFVRFCYAGSARRDARGGRADRRLVETVGRHSSATAQARAMNDIAKPTSHDDRSRRG